MTKSEIWDRMESIEASPFYTRAQKNEMIAGWRENLRRHEEIEAARIAEDREIAAWAIARGGAHKAVAS